MLRFVYIFFVLLLFIGCATKENKKILKDLSYIPQDISYFVKYLPKNRRILPKQKEYDKYFFSPWNTTLKVMDKDDAKWAFKTYRFGDSYGENLQLLSKNFFKNMYDEANFKNYMSLKKYAISLKNLNLRAFPTSKPLFRDFNIAGEGFPFDYLQNSTLYINKPLFVSHYSKSKEWVYVYSSFTSGWVKSDEIAILNNNDIKKIISLKHLFIIKEGINIYDNGKRFLFSSKIGMRFPLLDENDLFYTVLFISGDENSNKVYKKIKIPKGIATDSILKIDAQNMQSIISEIFHTKYGWGGLYGDRDCSSTIRDIFTPFGIWLPRNSSKQAKVGKVISLEGLGDKQKIKIIKKEAVAFETLLYKKGHILLYVGTFKGKVVVLHNTWGIKTKENAKEGRFVIGKIVLSTLELGKSLENYDKESKLLTHIKSFNIITKSN